MNLMKFTDSSPKQGVSDMRNQFTFKTSVHIDFLLSVDRDEFIEYLLMQDEEVGEIVEWEPVDVSNKHITIEVVYKMKEWQYMDFLAESNNLRKSVNYDKKKKN